MSKVSVDQVLPVSADVVWSVIGHFNGVPEWHPAVETSEIEVKDGNKLRTLNLVGGASLIEKLEKHDDGARSYEYSIVSAGPLPVANYRAAISVTPEGAGCRVTWSSQFESEGAPQGEAEAAIRGIYEAGFENLKKMFGAQ